MTMFKIEFDRIGQNHNVEALFAEARDADHLAALIYKQIKGRLGSRNVDVLVDLERGRADIFCGVRNGGSGRITEVAK